MAPEPDHTERLWIYLVRHWNEGCTMGKQLLAEIRLLGYTGSLTHLQRRPNSWLRAHFVAAIGVGVPVATAAPSEPTTHMALGFRAPTTYLLLRAATSCARCKDVRQPPETHRLSSR
jgi:hypothetical protein